MVYVQNAGVPDDFFRLAEGIIHRELQDRQAWEGSEAHVSLAFDENLPHDSYTVSETGEIRSDSPCGLLSGIGRYLHEGRFDGKGQFIPSGKAFSLTPKKPIRGMYFATHFFNFYHVAPMDKMRSVMDSLVLRGCNALMFWYDMNHYTAVDTPESKSMIERLKQIHRYATELGMKMVAVVVANEGYHGTPDALKARYQTGNGYVGSPVAHTHQEICPNAEGGMKEILRLRKELIRAFAGFPFDYVLLWPYDSGCCTCEKCAPWGSNGYLKTAKELKKLFDEEMPGAELILSTWRFNTFTTDDEWGGFCEKLDTPDMPEFTYLMTEVRTPEEIRPAIREKLRSGEMKMMSFPEISMWGATPWGGFGCNPFPRAWESYEKTVGDCYTAGCLAYSEGIFEDINKALVLGFESGQYTSSRAVIEDYVRYEFCVDDPTDIADILYDMEETLPRTRTAPDGAGVDYFTVDYPAGTDFHFVLHNTGKIDDVYRRTLEADKTIPEAMRHSWRWRIVYLRAVIDHELLHNGGRPTERCTACYQELIELYYAQNADYSVCPPTEESLLLNRGHCVLG